MIRGSLRQRLLQVVLLSLAPAFFIHIGILIFSDMRTAADRAAANTQDIATAAMPMLQSALIVSDLATAQETLDSVMRHGQFRRLRLLDQNGAQVLLEGRQAAEIAAFGVPNWFINRLDVRYPLQRFPLVTGGVRYGVLEAEPSSLYLVEDIWWRMWSVLILWGGTLTFAIFLLRFSLWRGLRPLEDLAKAACCIGEGNMDCRAPVSDVPELALTARAFNRMADNLSEARDRLEERIRQATRDLENLIRRIPAGVYKLRIFPDDKMHFDFVSPRWCELMELDAKTLEENPGAPLSQLHEEELDNFVRLFELAKQGPGAFHWEGRMREGMQAVWLRIEAIPTRQDNGDVLWEGIVYDISANKMREVALDHIAHFDSLTGIPNRMLLADRLRLAIYQAQRTGSTLAVCAMDLDGFKPVNDTYGHKAGDLVLKEIAHRLSGIVRGGDTVARMGGDEFVLLLAGMTHVDEYQTTLSRILDVVNLPIQIETGHVNVSASLGVALYPKDGVDSDQLLREADQAMYQAKQSGRSRFVFFDQGLEEEARQLRELLQEMESGLQTNAFEVHYQPRVNMREGRVTGFEALIRWRHPTRGLLLPREFLPLIEDNDLILCVDEWIIDNVLQQLADWRRQGLLELGVSVNVAPRHLQAAHFTTRLKSSLGRHPELPPELLEIEIVEMAALSDRERVAQVIRECRNFGVLFVLDDFGAGYSSLSYLKSLPAQTLKIDQSFVRNMHLDANDLAIVEGVIDLANIFHRNVVAEGVETSEQCALLLNLGCELAQGFAIAPPMPATEAKAWLEIWTPDPAWTQMESNHWPRDDLPLIIAENNHRAWIEKLLAYIEGNRNLPPELEDEHCHFGQWYRSVGFRRYGQLPEYIAIDETHQRIHLLGRELAGLSLNGQSEQARALLPELLTLKDALLAHLHDLMAAAARQP